MSTQCQIIYHIGHYMKGQKRHKGKKKIENIVTQNYLNLINIISFRSSENQKQNTQTENHNQHRIFNRLKIIQIQNS